MEHTNSPQGSSGSYVLLHGDRVPFLKGRPHREEPITGDDITNLKIELNTSESVEEFLERV